jgi:hypothetical protein
MRRIEFDRAGALADHLSQVRLLAPDSFASNELALGGTGRIAYRSYKVNRAHNAGRLPTGRGVQ